MKELINKMISNAHIVILLYGIYGVYVAYDEHSVQLEGIHNEGLIIDDEIAQSQRKLKEIQEFVKKTEEYKVRVEEVAKNIEAAQKQLPAETNDAQILSFFQKEIGALNIKDPNISPGREDKSTYFVSKEYSLKAKGTFLQFLIFFERIGNADRIYNIKKLTLTSEKEGQKGRFQTITGEGVIQAYRFNPDFRVERGF